MVTQNPNDSKEIHVTRQTKTDAQRAQDALDVANRQVERAVYRRNSLRVQLKTAAEVTSSGQPQTVPGGDDSADVQLP